MTFIYREEVKDCPERLRKIHGDFHPGNIRFQSNNRLMILDASRIIWGEPADDVSSLAINYVWYALKQTGEFEGIFADLFDVFLQDYIQRSEDKEISRIIPLYFAIRSVVFTHPLFFEADEVVRRKMFNLSTNLMREKDFNSGIIRKILAK